MSIGPVSGASIPVSLPYGKTVFWSMLVQADYDQFVQLKDSQGNVQFTATGTSSGGGQPTQVAQGFFQVGDQSGAYTLSLGVNGGAHWSSVIYSSDVLNLGSTIYFGSYIFVTEDATDADYNDTCFQMNWFQYLG